MGAATALPVRDVQVEPGATATAKMLVRNTGQVVDQYTIDIVGACVEWTQVEPKVVNLLPGADVEVTITFAPARDPHVPAGVVPFGIRVLSREDPQGSAVAEGSVEVAAFADVQVELVPRSSRGRRKAKHQVAIDNNGNQPTTVEVSAQDEEEALDFRFDHRMASIEPGAAAFIKLTAKPEKRFLKGADRQHPFIVTVAPNNSTPIATRGTMTQRQLLPAWLLPLIAAVAALVIAAVVLYFTLVKPQINATAKDAASKAVKSANSSASKAISSAVSAANAAKSQASAANSNANEAKDKATSKNGGGSNGAGGNGGGSVGRTGLTGGQEVQFTLQGNKHQSSSPTSIGITNGPTIPANKVLVITAIVFQNPNGDLGTLEVDQGTNPLFREGLANFRDLDYHFDNNPLAFTTANPLSMQLTCTKGQVASTCQPLVLFTGRWVTKPTSA